MAMPLCVVCESSDHLVQYCPDVLSLKEGRKDQANAMYQHPNSQPFNGGWNNNSKTPILMEIEITKEVILEVPLISLVPRGNKIHHTKLPLMNLSIPTMSLEDTLKAFM
ncbi:hypothetical protein GIB67_016784 [Kingdonia uniflora]|uniref:Uncharacterized protein n=1 Tax=Kingdonia uniflora TaxID=39325 RepID=A0A7J7LXU8_9MAGN|nr:hypothetical protein GIB67_016784 [Kingdonia uniflora]